MSVTSLSTVAHPQPSLTVPSRMRPNRSISRVSFLTTSLENTRILKPIHHGGVDDSKAGLHVEFKLSTQTDDNKQPTQTSNDPKGLQIF